MEFAIFRRWCPLPVHVHVPESNSSFQWNLLYSSNSKLLEDTEDTLRVVNVGKNSERVNADDHMVTQ